MGHSAGLIAKSITRDASCAAWGKRVMLDTEKMSVPHATTALNINRAVPSTPGPSQSSKNCNSSSPTCTERLGADPGFIIGGRGEVPPPPPRGHLGEGPAPPPGSAPASAHYIHNTSRQIDWLVPASTWLYSTLYNNEAFQDGIRRPSSSLNSFFLNRCPPFVVGTPSSSPVFSHTSNAHCHCSCLLSSRDLIP